MLVLNRREGEFIVIRKDIHVKVVKVLKRRVRLGFLAPSEIPIMRGEIHQGPSANPESENPQKPRPHPPSANGGDGMLVLSRKKNESIVINDDITIVVVEIRGDKVRLGVEAPKEVPVHRQEVFDAIRRDPANPSSS